MMSRLPSAGLALYSPAESPVDGPVVRALRGVANASTSRNRVAIGTNDASDIGRRGSRASDRPTPTEGARVTMRFHAGDYLVDVVVDIDQFELPITKFLPGITADTIQFARTLRDPNHMEATRTQLVFAIPSFA